MKRIYELVFIILCLCAQAMMHADNFSDPFNITSGIIQSPANARGVHNVDADDITPDSFPVICSDISVIDELLTKVSCSPTFITAAELAYGTYTITSSGLYKLVEDASVSGGTAITIASNNVTLDLCGFSISGTYAQGIQVAESVQNVLITHGKISDVTIGIEVLPGAHQIGISQLEIRNTSSYALLFDGGPVYYDRIENCMIKDCAIVECISSVSDTGDMVCFFDNVENLTLDHLLCNENGHDTGTSFLYIMNIENCDNVSMIGCVYTKNYGGRLDVIRVRSSANILVSGCKQERNKAFNSFLIGCDIDSINNIHIVDTTHISNFAVIPSIQIDISDQGTNENMVIKNFRSYDLGLGQGSSSFTRGLSLVSPNVVVLDSVVEGSGYQGFNISGSHALLKNCIALNVQNEAGYKIFGAVSNVQLVDCIAQSCNQGFIMEDSPATSIEFKRCQALYNTNVGFNFNSSTALVLGNLSAGNGTNYTNQGSIVGIITSQKNARGWDNIDGNNTAEDAIESKICAIEDLLQNSAANPQTITQADINAGTYTISTSGRYIITEPITTTNSPVIQIAGSVQGVELDIQGYAISSTGAIGIRVQPGVSNIYIHDGILKNIGDSGAIRVEAGTRDIHVNNMIFENIGLRSLYDLGSTHSSYRNCVFKNCMSSAIVYCIDCQDLLLEGIVVADSGFDNQNFVPIEVRNTDRVFVRDFNITNNDFASYISGTLFGVVFNNVTNGCIEHGAITENRSVGTTIIIYILNNSNNIIISDVDIRCNTSINGNSNMILTQSNTQNLIIENVNISNNVTFNSFFGMQLQVTSHALIRNVMCIANAVDNTIFTNLEGFRCLGVSHLTFDNCIAMDINKLPPYTNYISRGFFCLNNNTTAPNYDNISFLNCMAFNMVGSNAADQGFSFNSPASGTSQSNLFLSGCTACYNDRGFNFETNIDACVVRCLAADNSINYRTTGLGANRLPNDDTTGTNIVNKTPTTPSASSSGWDNIRI